MPAKLPPVPPAMAAVPGATLSSVGPMPFVPADPAPQQETLPSVVMAQVLESVALAVTQAAFSSEGGDSMRPKHRQSSKVPMPTIEIAAPASRGAPTDAARVIGAAEDELCGDLVAAKDAYRRTRASLTVVA